MINLFKQTTQDCVIGASVSLFKSLDGGYVSNFSIHLDDKPQLDVGALDALRDSLQHALIKIEKLIITTDHYDL